MSDLIQEQNLTTSPSPLSIKQTEDILKQMKNCICKLYVTKQGTGFFIKIPYKNDSLTVLMTNNHVIGKKEYEENSLITIYLNNEKERKSIRLDKERLFYTNEEFDVTIIEIKEEKDNIKYYLQLDDKIKESLSMNINEISGFLKNIYSTKSIYSLNYPEGKDVMVSYSQPPKFDGKQIQHKCQTKPGSSGAPILLSDNQKVMGIHCGFPKDSDFNEGLLLIYPIIEFNNNINMIKIDKKSEEKLIEIQPNVRDAKDLEKFNNLFGSDFIKNNYDCLPSSNNINFTEINEKQISDYIQNSHEILEQNEIILLFQKYHKDNSQKKQNLFNDVFSYFLGAKTNIVKIKIKFTKPIKDCSKMFNNCQNLIYIDLSHFDSSNVTNMSDMFYYCENLKKINLSNLNTKNVTDMSYMFCGCYNLKTIDLSSFKTENVTNMGRMFLSCKKLEEINLQNFNTQKVKNMISMFKNCYSLEKINLLSFNIENVVDMSFMFLNCRYLCGIDLSSFDVKNIDVNRMILMFGRPAEIDLKVQKGFQSKFKNWKVSLYLSYFY